MKTNIETKRKEKSARKKEHGRVILRRTGERGYRGGVLKRKPQYTKKEEGNGYVKNKSERAER